MLTPPREAPARGGFRQRQGDDLVGVICPLFGQRVVAYYADTTDFGRSLPNKSRTSRILVSEQRAQNRWPPSRVVSR